MHASSVLELTVGQGWSSAYNTRPSVIDRTRFGCKRNYGRQRRCTLFCERDCTWLSGNREKDTLFDRDAPGTLMTDRFSLSPPFVLSAHGLSLGGSESVSFAPVAETFRIFARDSDHISRRTRQQRDGYVSKFSYLVEVVYFNSYVRRMNFFRKTRFSI